MTTKTTPSPLKPVPKTEPIPDANPISTEDLLAIGSSDTDIANLVYRRYGHRIRYVSKLGEFRVFIVSSHLWLLNAEFEVRNLIVKTLEWLEHKVNEARPPSDAKLLREFEDNRERIRSLCVRYKDTPKLNAAVARLADNPAIRCDVEMWDANPDALLFKDGMKANLRTGAVSPARPEDLLTIKMGIRLPRNLNKDVTNSSIVKIISEMFQADSETLDYFRKSLFYTLEGGKDWKAWFVIHGQANTGKTSLLKLIKSLAGDYGGTLKFDSFEDNDRAERRFDLAKLKGKRYAMIDESALDKILDAKRMKLVTGGSEITAEHKYRDPFDFQTQFAVWLGTNYKPQLKNDDGAVWARMRLFTLTRTFKVDAAFSNRMPSEENLQDLFIWIFQAREPYWAEGMREMPKSMSDSLDSYRLETDWLGEWIEEELEQCDQKEGSTLQEMFENNREWRRRVGHTFSLKRSTFKSALEEKGIRQCDASDRRRKPESDNKESFIVGWRIRPDSEIGVGDYR